MADKEQTARPENAYEAAIQAQERVLERGRKGKVLVRDEERPWESTRQGRIRYFLHPDMYPDTALQEWRVFSQEIPAQSGKHRHQGGVAIYILEGEGYTIADGKRYDWKKGDLLTLPIKPEGVVFQHFNASEKEPALLIAAEPNLVATTGVDRACGFEQLEEAPEHVQRRGK